MVEGTGAEHPPPQEPESEADTVARRVAERAGVPLHNAEQALQDCNGAEEAAVAKALQRKADNTLDDDRVARQYQGQGLSMRHGVNPERNDPEDNSRLKQV